MLRFCTTIHACPAEAGEGPTAELAGSRYRTLNVAPSTLAAMPFDCTFEEAESRLAALPRMFIEPDGSFVWTSPQAEIAWQVDGNLYDRAGSLAFVDLKGDCPQEAFDRLLEAFGWPATRLVFQLTREALLLDEAEFRRLAEASKA